MKKATKLSAFTLIELLIVIAIIGILAGLMFPAIQNVMGGAKATQVGNNGRSIVQAIMQSNTEREAGSSKIKSVWPKVSPSGAHNYTAEDANSYFEWLLKNEYVKDITFTELAGGGVSPATDYSDLTSGNGNIWQVLAANGNPAQTSPFLWTRNADQITDTDINNFDQTSTAEENWQGKLNKDVDPFNADLVVVVRRGGGMETIKANQLTDYAFMKGVTVSNTIAVMKAGTADLN